MATQTVSKPNILFKISPPRLVIVGGLGFIFSHVTEYFVEKGWEVIVIDNCSVGSHPEIINGSFQFIKLDFSEKDAWKTVVDLEPAYFIAAAGITDVDYSIHYPQETLINNLMCNLNAFEAARRLVNLKKFIYVSTDEILGECNHRKTEEEILFPKNPYSCSKAAGSLMRYAYDNTYPGLFDRTAETRFCNVFGPRQDARKILPRIIQSIKKDEPLPVHNGGVGKREYIYVKNIPPVIDLILQKGTQSYNITTNDSYTVNELINKVELALNKNIKTVDSLRPGMDIEYQMDSSRIRLLGWSPTYNFENGLEEYLKSEIV